MHPAGEREYDDGGSNHKKRQQKNRREAAACARAAKRGARPFFYLPFFGPAAEIMGRSDGAAGCELPSVAVSPVPAPPRLLQPSGGLFFGENW